MADMIPIVRPVFAGGCVVITDQTGDEAEDDCSLVQPLRARAIGENAWSCEPNAGTVSRRLLGGTARAFARGGPGGEGVRHRRPALHKIL